ncbi:hypothetical protein AHF37_11919 [Paragonimus kellicotti]|nr:hypothetical protein AHF37_11919 [Paragonimus kellicotti]
MFAPLCLFVFDVQYIFPFFNGPYYILLYFISTQLAQMMAHSAEEFVRHVWLRGWQVVHHRSLPAWLKDNDYILRYHRPQLNTCWACFKSIFRVHTETGNIWTHLLAVIGLIMGSLVDRLRFPTLCRKVENFILNRTGTNLARSLMITPPKPPDLMSATQSSVILTLVGAEVPRSCCPDQFSGEI